MEQQNEYTHVQTDYGPQPFVVNIARAAIQNSCYRRALWTGDNLQLTLMCIPPCGEIGLEVHPETDQFIRLEEGQGMLYMGNSKDCLNFQTRICRDEAIFVPAGTWHNIINISCIPLKIYTIYAPPHHPYGTIQCTKADIS